MRGFGEMAAVFWQKVAFGNWKRKIKWIYQKYLDAIRRRFETDPAESPGGCSLPSASGVKHQKPSKLADKQPPYGYREIYKAAVKNTREVRRSPQSECLTNIFGPVEIFQCFGLNLHPLRCWRIYVGFLTEDYFIDRAESIGIAPTLCSYHKHFSRHGGIRRHAFSGFTAVTSGRPATEISIRCCVRRLSSAE